MVVKTRYIVGDTVEVYSPAGRRLFNGQIWEVTHVLHTLDSRSRPKTVYTLESTENASVRRRNQYKKTTLQLRASRLRKVSR